MGSSVNHPYWHFGTLFLLYFENLSILYSFICPSKQHHYDNFRIHLTENTSHTHWLIFVCCKGRICLRCNAKNSNKELSRDHVNNKNVNWYLELFCVFLRVSIFPINYESNILHKASDRFRNIEPYKSLWTLKLAHDMTCRNNVNMLSVSCNDTLWILWHGIVA